MRTRIEKLDRDALLMLYASGEMTLEQKQRVDEMLAGDESMRNELSQLLDAQVMLDRELAQIDQADQLPISEPAATRAVSRVIRQRQAEVLAAPMRVSHAPNRRWMVLMYPAGIAAAIMGFGIYKWSKVSDNDLRPAVPIIADGSGDGQEDYAEESTRLFADLDRHSDEELDGVERQISALAEWSKSVQ